MPTGNIHLNAALDALELGFSPLPPEEDGSKRPLADVDGSWKIYQSTPASHEKVHSWYRTGRTGNGLATGYGNLECLEFDDAGTYDEFKRVATGIGIEELVERVDSGYCEVSPGGGYHWLYICEEVRGNTKLAERPIPGEPLKREVLIETRGKGGFIVTAPSCGRVHPTGGAYRLLRGRLETIVVVSPSERDALWEVAKTFDESPSVGSQEAPFVPSGIPHDSRPGDEYEAAHTWEDILEPMGWTKVFVRSGVIYWRRPGKDIGISATTGHCKGLYVFTTSTIFPANQSYSKFGVYAVLHHGGDYAAAARDLAKQGYGEPLKKKVRRQSEDPPPPAEIPEAEPATVGEPNLTELGNARRLVATYGQRLRYCKPLGVWYEWDGTRWRPDEDGSIWRYAKEVIRELGQQAADTDDDKTRARILRWALKSEERKVLSATIDLAWSEPGMSVAPDQFDRNPWLLNCPNGTIDLKTGALQPHNPSDLISKRCLVPYEPGRPCPRWKNVLDEILGNDAELIGYIQRAFGYSITGIVAEHALFLCHGTGRNGKNTILEAVMEIVNDYGTVTDPRTFLSSGKGDHPAMLADLLGRRFVPTSEVDHGEKLAEGLVKRVTGDKVIKARFMRQNPFEFPVLFKIWMLANHKPDVKGQDEGIWSRIRLIPFDVFIPPEKRIKNLSEILVKEEGPAILGWLVQGCLEWQRVGLSEPRKVVDAIKVYRHEQDVIGDFLDNRCESFLNDPILRTEANVRSNELYSSYLDWCKTSGEKASLSARKFGSEMGRRQYALDQKNGVSYRVGLRLKDDHANGYALNPV